MIQITSLEGNTQRLDGGAMFGNAPRVVWERWIAPDALNRIPLACRCLLVQDGRTNILCETGIGAFFEPSLRERYGVQEARHVLLDQLAALGLSDVDIDVVVLSHLHFDHAGGLLAAWEADKPARLLFPRAQIVTSRAAWERAQRPHARDRASFVPELNRLLNESGRLVLVDGPTSPILGDAWRFHYSEGHTPGLLLAEIQLPGGPMLFAGDLIPGVPWVHVPITMGYDRFPERLIDEKQALLEDLLERGGRLFFTHDATVAVGRVQRDAKGRFSVGDTAARLVGLAE